MVHWKQTLLDKGDEVDRASHDQSARESHTKTQPQNES